MKILIKYLEHEDYEKLVRLLKNGKDRLIELYAKNYNILDGDFELKVGRFNSGMPPSYDNVRIALPRIHGVLRGDSENKQEVINFGKDLISIVYDLEEKYNLPI